MIILQGLVLLLHIVVRATEQEKADGQEQQWADFQKNFQATPFYLQKLENLPNVPALQDAEHRGPAWYDYSVASQSDSVDASKLESKSTLTSGEGETKSLTSGGASSQDTDDAEVAKRPYRACSVCYHDMLKSFRNVGIRWVCGSYQRARRTFKSECMLRYRNCQDGTMFVKISDGKCRNDTFHGRHWFYVYKT